MSLATPESVQKLQTALHGKAKKSPDFRFYALYDKVYREDVLTFAYDCCKANGGAAGFPDAGHRPPLKPCMQFSRTRLSRRLILTECYGRY